MKRLVLACPTFSGQWRVERVGDLGWLVRPILSSDDMDELDAAQDAMRWVRPTHDEHFSVGWKS